MSSTQEQIRKILMRHYNTVSEICVRDLAALMGDHTTTIPASSFGRSTLKRQQVKGAKPFPERSDFGQTYKASPMKKPNLGKRFNGKHND